MDCRSSQCQTWERLERSRLQQLGIPNRFSRHLCGSGCSKSREMSAKQTYPRKPIFDETLRAAIPQVVTKRQSTSLGFNNNAKPSNSIAPFYTQMKPTCGYFFTRETDNKKKNFGIPPTDLVLWRSFIMQH